MNVIEQNQKQIERLCLEYKVKSLFVFGSVLTDKFNSKSDIDFLVNFENVELSDYADNYFELADALEKLMNRKVDLISEKTITNPYLLKSINRNRIKLYERRNPGMAA